MHANTAPLFFVLLCASALLVLGQNNVPAVGTASVNLSGRDMSVNGSCRLSASTPDNLTVNCDVWGLPDGQHIFDFFDSGDLSAVPMSLGNPGNFNMNFTSSNGYGGFIATVTGPTLNGPNSLIGRSMASNTSGSWVYGLIARNQSAMEDQAAPQVPPTPNFYRLIAFLKPTPGLQGDPAALNGSFISFVNNKNASVDITYVINGLTSNYNHPVALQELGDFRNLGGVFANVGTIQNGPAGLSRGFWNNASSISNYLGRVIAVYGNNASDASNIVAFGVIGLSNESPPPPPPPAQGPSQGYVVRRASCVVRGTVNNPGPVDGYVDFSALDDGNVAIRWAVAGFPPSSSQTWHVHENGNICLQSGASTGGHFVGNCNATTCRPGAPLQEIGLIGDGAKIYTSPAGVNSGAFADRVIKLNGNSSIVGRSLIFHNATGARIAQCVIGAAEYGPETTDDIPPVMEASCRVAPTAKNGNPNLDGYFYFHSLPDMNVQIDYYVTGLLNGTHGWHVHLLGEIVDGAAALSTAGHFVGDCNATTCRPGASLQEVGLLANGTGIVANSSGIAAGYVIDNIIRLNGLRSIVGRSLVIHEAGTPANRVAECVIGFKHPTTTAAGPGTCPLLQNGVYVPPPPPGSSTGTGSGSSNSSSSTGSSNSTSSSSTGSSNSTSATGSSNTTSTSATGSTGSTGTTGSTGSSGPTLSTVVKRVKLTLNVTATVAGSTAFRTQLVIDIATALGVPTSRISIVSVKDNLGNALIVHAAAASGVDVTFDILPPTSASEPTADQLYTTLTTQINTPNSAIYNGQYTKSVVPDSVSAATLQKCSDNTVQSTCPSSGSNAGAVAGGTVGGVVGAIIIVAVIYYFYNKNKAPSGNLNQANVQMNNV